MSDETPTDGRRREGEVAPGIGSTDVLELSLPPKAEYLPVIQTAAGVLAGSMSFNYDEIIHVRTAVAEAFDLAVRRLQRTAAFPKPVDVKVRFLIMPEGLEVQIRGPQDDAGWLASQEDVESRALIESLMDEVELDGAATETPPIRMFKYRHLTEA